MPRPMPAINIGKGPRIMLASGSWFDFLDPEGSDFTIEDIAQGLGNICRYAGQCHQFYSVAEHSLHVSAVSPTNKLEALMHDAAEAFLGDVTRPLKQLLPEYKKIEKAVELAIFRRFDLDFSALATLKKVDLSVLAAEQVQIMPIGTDYWSSDSGIVPAKIKIEFLQPKAAAAAFLRRFRDLGGKR
jgi:uncharacterized protein